MLSIQEQINKTMDLIEMISSQKKFGNFKKDLMIRLAGLMQYPDELDRDLLNLTIKVIKQSRRYNSNVENMFVNLSAMLLNYVDTDD